MNVTHDERLERQRAPQLGTLGLLGPRGRGERRRRGGGRHDAMMVETKKVRNS